MSTRNRAQLLDLRNLSENASANGPQWGGATDDLNATLLSWESGHEIAAHTNSEVDVIWIVVAGNGEATIDGEVFELREGAAIVIPKGCQRALKAISPRFSYFSVHRRRAGLAIQNNTNSTFVG